MDTAKLLNGAGLKCTKQRLEIIAVMDEMQKPLSAEEIHSALHGVSVSTVYRNMEKLIGAGIAVKTVIPHNDGIYYELSYNKHRHRIVCLCCRKMRYIDECPVRETHLPDFVVTEHKLELYGYCADCMKGNF